MTKKRCTDCKHTRGIGFDFWCGEGHTEYEVFGAETNCPYYEYHDWSKGIPSRTEKRFTTKYTNHYVLEVDVYDNDERISFYETIDLLNKLHEENQNLKKENELMEKTLDNISGNLTEYRNKWVEI